jgi:hypothetical protein
VIICDKAEECDKKTCDWAKPKKTEVAPTSGHCSHRGGIVNLIKVEDSNIRDPNLRFRLRRENGF